MGNDGGTVAVQRAIVIHTKKTPSISHEQIALDQHHYWSACRYSTRPLRAGKVVACGKGYLYDKESVLEALLEKKFRKDKQLKKAFGHIRKLSDVTDVKFEVNPDFSEENSSVQTKWICAMSRKPIEGPQKCLLVRKCGHVVNEMTWRNPHLNPQGEEVLEELNQRLEGGGAVANVKQQDASNSKTSEIPKCMVCSEELSVKDLIILSASLTDFERFTMADAQTEGKASKKRKRTNGVEETQQVSKKRKQR